MPIEAADVSVIMPAYQAAGTIGRALESVARQTRPPTEVIVIDDGSDDGTADAAIAMIGRMAGIPLKVIRQENLGAGAARNRAVAEATATYVAFLDADDEWLPEKLQRTMPHLEGSDTVLVAHNFLRREGDGKETIVDSAGYMTKGNPYVTLFRRGFIGSITVVARKNAVDAAGGFDAALRTAQDFDLWLGLLKKPETPFVVLPDVLARYHVSDSGITSHTARRLRCCTEIAVRYFPDLKTRPGSALISLWFRITALHIEAARAYWSRGARGRAGGVWLLYPARLLAATGKVLSGAADPRIHR